jgi:hypothetical protein
LFYQSRYFRSLAESPEKYPQTGQKQLSALILPVFFADIEIANCLILSILYTCKKTITIHG